MTEEVKEEERAAQGSNSGVVADCHRPYGEDSCSCVSRHCFSFGCIARASSRDYGAKLGWTSIIIRRRKNMAGTVCPRTPLSGMGLCLRTPSAAIRTLRGRGSEKTGVAPAALG